VTRSISASRQARLNAGLSKERAARRLWISPARLLFLESSGWPRLAQVERAVALYRAHGAVCSVEDFMHGRVSGRASKAKTAGKTAKAGKR
jgi:hypothetical protein